MCGKRQAESLLTDRGTAFFDRTAKDGKAMKALVKFGKGREGMELRELPVPKPKDGEILLRIKAAGICGSDVHTMFDQRETAIPVTLGHEFAGVVEETCGDSCGLKKGDWVTGIPACYNCGHCEFCRRGEVTLCPEHKSLGVFKDGAMAEYMVMPARYAFRIPDEAGDKEIYAAAEPLGCIARGIFERLDVKKGDVVVVSGPGTMGLFAVECLKAAGAHVVVSGLPADHERLALAKKLGAEETAESTEELEEILKRVSPGGADIAVEAAGVAPSMNTCLRVVKIQGTILSAGLISGKHSIDFGQVFAKEVTIVGTNSTAVSTWHKVMAMMKEGKLDLRPLVSLRLPLDEWEKGFDATINKTAYKVLLIP